MRHGDKIKNLGRTASHRRALLSNLGCQLIKHKRIVTTLAKAKSLRVYAEPLITRCKVDNMNNRRIVFSYLQDKEAIKELFGIISDKVGDRPGGYTRIIKLQHRAGDAADMAMIELVDFNEIYGKTTETAARKTRRSRRSGGGKKITGETTTETVETNEDNGKVEAVANVESFATVTAGQEPIQETLHGATPEVVGSTPDSDAPTAESTNAEEVTL